MMFSDVTMQTVHQGGCLGIFTNCTEPCGDHKEGNEKEEGEEERWWEGRRGKEGRGRKGREGEKGRERGEKERRGRENRHESVTGNRYHDTP